MILSFPRLQSQESTNSKIVVLNMAESFRNQKDVPLSLIVNKITYVPLESIPTALISGNARFEITNDYIIVRQLVGGQKYQILLFNRITGKFIREIGKNGRGPGEYKIWSLVPFNEYKKELYAINSSGELLKYDLSGNNTGKIEIPEFFDTNIPETTDSKVNNQRILLTADNLLDSNIFAGYIVNNSGWEKRKLVLFSEDKITKIFPNSLTYKKDNQAGFGVPPIGGFSKFYKLGNKLNFIEAFCDTIYQVTKDSMIPRYYFNWGQFNAPYSEQITIRSDGHYWDYFYIENIAESNNYIFAYLIFKQSGYGVLVDKRNNKVTFCKPDTEGVSLIKDDVAGLMDLFPQSVTAKNEIISIIQPVKLMKWLNENPEKAARAREKYLWLKNIDEFSNPILAIGKCKD
jgi:hypothetical protein